MILRGRPIGGQCLAALAAPAACVASANAALCDWADRPSGERLAVNFRQVPVGETYDMMTKRDIAAKRPRGGVCGVCGVKGVKVGDSSSHQHRGGINAVVPTARCNGSIRNVVAR